MRRLTVVIAVTLVVLLTAGLAVAANGLRAVVRPAWNADRVLIILAIGSDLGLPRSGNPLRGRADGIHIIAVDTRRLKATIIDIPRDSYIAGDKVNAHLVRGGPERLKAVMSDYSGLDIDYWALTTFRGLESMVNDLGGVPVDIDIRLRDSAAGANLNPGRRRLNGEQALAFTRARKTVPGGDFTRTKHHGDLMIGVHRAIRGEHSDLVALTNAVGIFGRNVHTDIPKSQLLRLASLAVKIPPGDVRHVPLSGSTGSAGGASIVNLNPGGAFRDIRRGRIGR